MNKPNTNKQGAARKVQVAVGNGGRAPGNQLTMLALVGIAALSIAACGELEDPGTEMGEEATARQQSALVVNNWLGPISEEQGINIDTGHICGGANLALTGARCQNSWCDNMSVWCERLTDGNTPGFSTPGNSFFATGFVSEEGGSPPALCPVSFPIAVGIRAKGSFADDVSLICVAGTIPASRNCTWTPWFSEENGGVQKFFKANLLSRFHGVASGVKCQGSRCDSMSYFVCEPKCQSNADCSDTCNANGECTIH